MDNELQEPISEISEIPDLLGEPPAIHFGAAVLWGCLAGTVAFIAPLAVMEPKNAAQAIVAALIFVPIFAGVLTLAGMIAFGLPVTLILKAAGAEHRFLYAGIGAVAGPASTILLFAKPLRFDPEAIWFLVIGGLAGFAAAFRWGRWREALARYRQQLADEEAQPDKRSNPIHDLIH